MFRRTSDFHSWFSEQGDSHSFEVTPTPLDRLEGWDLDRADGALRHRSGRFFSVGGLRVAVDHPEPAAWSQPIIDQPESGILGLLLRRFGGVPHLLLQAKMEPGNINTLQLSPTVQATRSNYTGVHRGRAVPYLEYFLAPRRGRVLFDALQSEQGSWFLHKRNRNLIVEVDGEVPLRDGFCWLDLARIGELLRAENLVNMDTRTVLSGLPRALAEQAAPSEGGSFRESVTASARRGARALHDRPALLSWLTEARAERRLERSRIPLSQLDDWIVDHERISHRSGRYFSVIGVDVRAGNREVTSWSQPMLAPSSRGLIAFLTKKIRGTLHLLLRARTQAGTRDVVEIGPTVQCAPANHTGPEGEGAPALLKEVLSAPPSRIRLDVVHSEEGGRFYHAENRYLVVEAAADFPAEVPGDFLWATVDQFLDLVELGNHVNVEARNLLAGLRLAS
ncbi:NDP-hexose 2,3-dehydratase family protein [Streptomyces sp. TP-A0874]|uniref:NDP-hexose 2,3-dehydratase family protein n=1 Tax=Streptomyces sp. TP-A0874 TaxID=549819 RepID=UPI00085350B1|nr:NDP-hexose 2,3-dehydratase family protein [Streptomyces sp. TP-A0874]